MNFAALSRFRLGPLAAPLPASGGLLSVGVLVAAAVLVLAAWIVAAQLDPDLTGSWRWSEGLRLA
ncbi:MAG TPA: hypothetical protein VEI48_01015 [Candidatus Sulfotelmatobacter sp.]|nr:hypothetical protein [Candidatus Sulfotelmatobacter sp.]